MLNVRVVEVYNSIIYYLPIGLFLGLFFLIEIIYMIIKDFGINSIYLFVDHYLLVLILGWLLLVGMIGAIALTIDVTKKAHKKNLNYSLIKVDHTTYFWGIKQKLINKNQCQH